MKPTARIFRIVVPVFFSLLIIVFVAYRSGAFDQQLAIKKMMPVETIRTDLTAENSLAPMMIDSPPPPHRIMASSSKSTAIFDTSFDTSILKLIQYRSEEKKKKHTDSIIKQSSRKSPTIMSSSKSGAIFLPIADTTKKN